MSQLYQLRAAEGKCAEELAVDSASRTVVTQMHLKDLHATAVDKSDSAKRVVNQLRLKLSEARIMLETVIKDG